MFGSGMLDIVIGVFFVYLLLSLAVTSLNELVAAVLKSRGKHLWKGIENLFEKARDWSKSDIERAGQIAAADAQAKVRDAVAALQSSAAEAQQARDKRNAAQAHVETTRQIYDAARGALGDRSASTAILTEKIGAAAAAKAAAERDLAEAVSAAAAAFAKHHDLLSSQAADEGLRHAKLSVAAIQARGVADAAKGVSDADPTNKVKQDAKAAAATAADQAKAAAALVTPAAAPQGDSWSERLYNHSLIQALYQNTGNGKKRPSYIPAQTFAIALMDLVLPSGAAVRANTFAEIRSAVDKIPYDEGNKNIKEALLSLIREAENTADTASGALKKVQDQIEVWFNDTMDRVGGWYKRRTQYVVFGLAAVLVAVLNLDTITIARALSRDSALRATVVGMAEKATQPGPNQITVNYPSGGSTGEINTTTQPATQPATAGIQAADQAFQARLHDIEQLGIPIGWKFCQPPASEDHPLPEDPRYLNLTGGRSVAVGNLLLKVVGLLLTTLAATLGAPFWFDVLNKIVTIRASGKAPEEQPKSPKEVPTPREPAAGATPAPAGSPLRT